MVRVTTLDGALGDRCPNIVKIDVEGFETEVLAGARQMLGNAKLCCIVMEVAGSGTRYGFDEKKLREIMTQNGFGEYRYDPMTRKLAHSDAQNGNNSLFVRNLAHVERRLSQAPPVTVLGRSF